MIVKSILDTDLYKFTTSYAYMKLFPHDEVKVIYAPDITICSTAIRKWVDDGKIILPFVTDEVNSIIRKLGLYK